MNRLYKARIRLNGSDIWRTILTDTAPFEVPIIFSNDGFYNNLSDYENKSSELKNLIDALVIEKRRFTIPMRFRIINDAESVRTLSLLHPHGQVELSQVYNEYDQVMCEYGQRSPFSIRKPQKVGTSYYLRCTVSDKNKYKNASVDTIGIDSLVRNPASYFSYYGFARLYQFFSSPDYVRLEAKFKLQLSLDISRCFDSIYTHSIAWAVKSKELAKENTQALSFENQFDRVMQRLNHNETSGICIGPEASRIFAEIILAKADQDALTGLAQFGLRDGIDFECRRYVDDYYVFANSEEVLSKVHFEIAKALREYKLHLNESKKEELVRPFYNSKSLIRDKVNSSIQKLSEQIFDQRSCRGVLVRIPRRIHNRRSLFLNFTREVKAACFTSQLGYDAVANYVISAVNRMVVDLADTYPIARSIEDIQITSLHYRQLLSFLLDVGSYYFAFHPTVASSLRLSVAVVRTAQHLAKYDREGVEIVKEAIYRWTAQLLRSPLFSRLTQETSTVPVELLNVLISLREIGDDVTVVSELVEAAVKENAEATYFPTIVQLYIYGNHDKLSHRKNEVFQSACDRLLSARNLTRDAELTHLLLDLLACPFVDPPKREKLLFDIWPILRRTHNNIGKIRKRDARKIVREIEKQHWFVRWEGIDLLNMIEKKELSTVYA